MHKIARGLVPTLEPKWLEPKWLGSYTHFILANTNAIGRPESQFAPVAY